MTDYFILYLNHSSHTISCIPNTAANNTPNLLIEIDRLLQILILDCSFQIFVYFQCFVDIFNMHCVRANNLLHLCFIQTLLANFRFNFLPQILDLREDIRVPDFNMEKIDFSKVY